MNENLHNEIPGASGFLSFFVQKSIAILWCAAALLFLTTRPTLSTESDPLIQLDLSVFQFHVGDPLPSASSPIPGSSDNWLPLSEFKYSLLSNNHSLWLRTNLPEITYDEPALLLTAFVNEIDVYQGEILTYSYGPAPDDPEYDFKFHMSHVIPLNPVTRGTFLYLRIGYPDMAGFGELISVVLGATPYVIDNVISERDGLFRQCIFDVSIGLLLGIIGIASLFIYLVRYREKDYPFLSFGAFSLFAGATYLSDFNALFFLNLSPGIHFYFKSVSFLLVPVGLFAFVGHMFETRHRYILRSIWMFHLLFAAVSPYFIRYSIDYTYFILVMLIVNSLICIRFIHGSETGPRLLKLSFIVFLLIFIAILVAHMLEILNLIPTSYDVFGWGMLGFVFVLGYFLVQHYTRTFRAMKRVSVELEKNKSDLLEQQKETLRSQLEALKNQIDPHFLFNSFSTLSSIIEEDPKKAVTFVEELSRVYRYVLQNRVHTLVTLNEEIGFIESYRFLIKNRFGSNLDVILRIPEILMNSRIMPFSLQLLVENAIKHNIVSQKKPLEISIVAENEYLTVKNRLQKKNQPVKSTHIGLANIIKRYEMITEKKVVITETETEFTVRIPLIDPEGEHHEDTDR